MIPTRLFSGKIKIIRAYLGKSLIFQSVASLFANAKLKLQNNLSPKKAEARVLSCYKEDATKSNPSVTTASAAEISFGKEMRAKIASTLIAYRRAAMEYVRRIGTKLLSKLRSTAGKNANAIRKMASRLLALLTCAVVKILHLGNMIRTAAGSNLDTSGTMAVTAARAMENETSINPANVVAVTVNVSPAAATAHIATLTTFAEPEPGADDYLPETTATFKENTWYGCYGSTKLTLSKVLELGKTYMVEWDGTQYPCTAKAINYTNDNGYTRIKLALGNSGILAEWFGAPNVPDVSPTGEPFLLAGNTTTTSMYAYTKDTSTTHTVRIYVEQ